jgi:hypothetical protein
MITLIYITTHDICNARLTLIRKSQQPCQTPDPLTKPTAPTTASYRPKRGTHSALWHKVTPLCRKIGSELRNHLQSDQEYTWPTATYYNMISVRTRQGSNALKKIDKLQLINNKKNDKILKQQEEEIKQKKDKEEARRIQEEAEKEEEAPISYNIHKVMNEIDSTPMEAMEEDAYDNEEEHSPLKNAQARANLQPGGHTNHRPPRPLQRLPPQQLTYHPLNPPNSWTPLRTLSLKRL